MDIDITILRKYNINGGVIMEKTKKTKFEFKKPEFKKIQFKNMNFHSIRAKLIIYFTSLVLILSTVLGAVSLNRASNSLSQQSEKALLSLAYEGAKFVRSEIQTSVKVLEAIASREDIESMDWDLQREVLRRQIEERDFIDIAIVALDGAARYVNRGAVHLGNTEYIQRAFNGETNIVDLSVNKGTNVVTLIYATPIKVNDKVVGALVGYENGDTLSLIAEDTGFGNEGYAYIIDNDGTILGHPDQRMVFSQFNPIKESEEDESLKSIAEMFEKTTSRKRGLYQYIYEGNEYYAGYAPIEDTDWTFVFTSNKADYLEPINSLRNNILMVGGIILILSIILVGIIGNGIASPITHAANSAKKLGRLDITLNIPEKFMKRRDEVGDLAKSFQELINNLRDIVHEVNDSSEQVAAASEELTAASHESAITAEEVTKTMEEIARGAGEQATSTEDGALKANALGEALVKNKEYLVGLNTSAGRVSEIIEEGLVEIEKLSQITDESGKSIEEIHEIILRTDESSNEIGAASNLIASIADQTNLLALNAAIEAARAGDAGRGFAVVAEEIRKLAEQSSNSTETINKIVKELQGNSQNAVKTMERVSNITKEQEISVENNKKKYMAIEEAMGFTISITEKLNISEEKMEETKNNILDTLQNLTAIAEENSAATEQASASMEEQTAATEEIAGASEGLANLAQELKSIIDRFEV